jgi:hypothetical protein
MSEIIQGRQGLAELGSSCRVCQLLDCERRLVYPRVMALHAMRDFSGRDLAEWLDRLTANAEVATVLGSIPASSDTV